MKIFNFGKSISEQLGSEDSSKAARATAAKFELADLGGFLSFVKYVVFGVLASLNLHLFFSTIPGPFRFIVGIAAVLFESFAVYCWNNYSKAAGRYRAALGILAVGFTVISTAHATAALYEIMVGNLDAFPWLGFYSRFVAFPLLFGAMILGVTLLYALHWKSEISAAQAEAQEKIARSEAELIFETLNLDHRAQVETSRLDHFKKMTRIEAGYVEAVKDFAAVVTQGEQAIQSIGNPDVKRQLLEALGRLSIEPQSTRRIPGLAGATAKSESEDNSGK